VSGKVGYSAVNHWAMEGTDRRFECIKRHQSNIAAKACRAG